MRTDPAPILVRELVGMKMCERFGITYGCGRFIILMKVITEANPESSVNTSEGDQSKSKPTCLNTYSPQSSYECVDSKYLEGYVSCVLYSSK